jgi:hypothetical protein
MSPHSAARQESCPCLHRHTALIVALLLISIAATIATICAQTSSLNLAFGNPSGAVTDPT